jgi:hypothetical protein
MISKFRIIRIIHFLLSVGYTKSINKFCEYSRVRREARTAIRASKFPKNWADFGVIEISLFAIVLQKML